VKLDNLLSSLGLCRDDFAFALDHASSFPLKLSRHYRNQIQPGNPNDPLLLQILPRQGEHHNPPEFSSDPVDDTHYSPVSGLICKYPGRALLITTATCPIHCRFCFRRHYPYPSQPDYSAALAYVHQNPDITEIILSGGDPLSLNDHDLCQLIHQLESIPHLTTLRFHTRFAAVMPERITTTLTNCLSHSRLQLVWVNHFNHAHEITPDTISALNRLPSRMLRLNQSVLLQGVNDTLHAQINLSHALLRAGVTPYYVYLLDKVWGSAHFLVEDNTAQELITAMHAHLPGYLVPKLVRDIPGKSAKTITYPTPS
jgi:L-lysine 2,3-aminomutase